VPAEFNPKYTRPLGGMIGDFVRPTGRQSSSRKRRTRSISKAT